MKIALETVDSNSDNIVKLGIDFFRDAYDDAVNGRFERLSLLLGIILVLLGCYVAYKVVNLPPERTSLLHKALLTLCFLIGFPLLIASHFSSYFKTSPQDCIDKTKPVTANEVLLNLKNNGRVAWVARLILRKSGTEAGEKLSINNLPMLGPAQQRYTFVADYKELVGKTAIDAARMLGANIGDNDSISAIIFPLERRKLYPANARGLLQVISNLERDNITVDQNKVFDVKTQLGSNKAFYNLSKDSDPIYWAWDNYKEFYPDYCRVALKFRCDIKNGVDWPVANYLGDVSEDWHPLGFAQKKSGALSVDPCNETKTYCDVTSLDNWQAQIQSSFGARVFLIENLSIPNLNGRILIDFNKPESERIPYLYLD